MDKVIFKPKILVRKEKIAKIAVANECCKAAVHNALNYTTNSDLAVKIRNSATNRFGAIKVAKYPYLVEE